MKIKQVIILSLLPLMLIPAVSFSANAEVTWTKPSDYRDIDSGDQSRERFNKGIFKKDRSPLKIPLKIPRETAYDA